MFSGLHKTGCVAEVILQILASSCWSIFSGKASLQTKQTEKELLCRSNRTIFSSSPGLGSPGLRKQRERGAPFAVLRSGLQSTAQVGNEEAFIVRLVPPSGKVGTGVCFAHVITQFVHQLLSEARNLLASQRLQRKEQRLQTE